VANRFLAIYLNDHLAGATFGVELARRVRSSNRDDAELGEPLARVCEEIEADRETLELVMDRLAVSRDPVKPTIAWFAEKLGRLKLNGRLHGYSPLSRLVELEGLCIGITGKIELWASLRDSLGPQWSGLDFRQLSDRAAGQRETVEELHRLAAKAAFSPTVG
jgi:hypothetical protein